jgi:Domain of unknown function (DUF4850)
MRLRRLPSAPCLAQRPLYRAAIVGTITLVMLAYGALAVSAASQPRADAYPGTLKGPLTASNLRVVACPSTYGINYGSGPGPRSVVGVRARVTIPTRLVGKLSLYSDHYRSIRPVLAPAGWKCSAAVGADGGGGVIVTPRGSNVTGEELSYSYVPACVGCAFDVYCPFANAAIDQAADQGSCPMPSVKQTDQVVYQTPSTSVGTLFVEDPPGVSGTMTPYGVPLSHYYVTAGYVSYNTVGDDQMLSEVLSCTLPSSQVDVCQTSWSEGFAEHLVIKYSSSNT